MKHLYYLLFTFSIGFAQVPTVWWVDGANGNDNNDGKSEAAAFKTVQKVFDSSLLGNYVDTIKVKPGTYDFADASVSNANKAFIMIGTASNVSQTIFDAGGKNNFFYMSSNADTVTVFDGITFKNGKSTQSGGAFTCLLYTSPSPRDS